MTGLYSIKLSKPTICVGIMSTKYESSFKWKTISGDSGGKTSGWKGTCGT